MRPRYFRQRQQNAQLFDKTSKLTEARGSKHRHNVDTHKHKHKHKHMHKTTSTSYAEQKQIQKKILSALSS